MKHNIKCQDADPKKTAKKKSPEYFKAMLSSLNIDKKTAEKEIMVKGFVMVSKNVLKKLLINVLFSTNPVSVILLKKILYPIYNKKIKLIILTQIIS